MTQQFKVGDYIKVLDNVRCARRNDTVPFLPVWGTIVELDEHPFGDSYAKVKVDGPSLDCIHVWVDLRFAQRSTLSGRD